MKKAKRVFLIVLDSFGIGEAPDAAEFGIVADGGDVGGDTLGSVASSPAFNAPNLTRLGLFNIDGQASKIPGGVLPAHFDHRSLGDRGRYLAHAHAHLSRRLSR